MKKILFVMIALATMVLTATITNASEKINEYENVTLAASSYEITVHYIKQVGGDAWSDTPYSATYNPNYGDYGEITVKGMTYTVHLNRAYGQERDGRAKYKYEAAGYYFNL